MKPAIVSEMPPDNFRALTLQSEPNGDVGFVVKIGHDDFTAIFQRLTNSDADKPHKRSRIHAKGNLVRMPGIHQQRDACAGPRYRLVHLLRLFISAAPWNIAMKKMVGHGVQYGPG